MKGIEGEGKIHPYVALARISVELTAQGQEPSGIIDPALFSNVPGLDSRRACFVSITKDTGELRGCIGTIYPAFPRLYEEIIHNAEAAADSDPRFMPLRPEEAGKCRVSVDVLEEPVPAACISELDPVIYGVIVEKGQRRGVLLPDLEGVETPEQQVSIAMRKAGIISREGMKLWKFRVSRYRE